VNDGRNIVALDLGTKTGYAAGLADCPEPSYAGTWVLGKARELRDQSKRGDDRNCDLRLDALGLRLDDVVVPGSLVVFEDVQFASTTMQAHLWASLRAAVWMQGRKPAVTIRAVPVGTLKKFATGKGNATKEMMAASLYAAHPSYISSKFDDNAVDAIHLWFYAKAKLL
jgi:hypothetical protein